ncbi:MAG: hypothetical protein KatS3mg090_0495 [Patescibacteria group bacterium]|nr:MAG: hypothetical protein KatS3mg090_0495 [Patescibacteria group bacterium]
MKNWLNIFYLKKVTFKQIVFLSLIFVFLVLLNINFIVLANTASLKDKKIRDLVYEFGDINYDNAEYYNLSLKSDFSLFDARSANLKKFIRKYYPESPLYDLSDKIVEISDKYGLDYRLLVAIAMQESNLCKRIPVDSHNCWGWGIYGDTVTRFSSYEEGLETVARGLKLNYVDKGYNTIYSIMRKYNPSSNGSWGNAVLKFFLVLENL